MEGIQEADLHEAIKEMGVRGSFNGLIVPFTTLNGTIFFILLWLI